MSRGFTAGYEPVAAPRLADPLRGAKRRDPGARHAPCSPSLLPLFFLVRRPYSIAFSTPVADFFHSPRISFSDWLRPLGCAKPLWLHPLFPQAHSRSRPQRIGEWIRICRRPLAHTRRTDVDFSLQAHSPSSLCVFVPLWLHPLFTQAHSRSRPQRIGE